MADSEASLPVPNPRITPWLQYAWKQLSLSLRRPIPRYAIEYEMDLPRLKGARLRQYRPEDFAACREICALNAPNRFPPDTLSCYEAYLAAVPQQYLVVEADDRIVGCGGYQLQHPDFAHLVYGLVHPVCQRMGVGRLLLFGRIAQLPLIATTTVVAICAVKRSMPYYERYGFKLHDEPWEDSEGGKHPRACLIVDAHIIHRARLYLERVKVPVPDLRDLPAENPEWLRGTKSESGDATP